MNGLGYGTQVPMSLTPEDFAAAQQSAQMQGVNVPQFASPITPDREAMLAQMPPDEQMEAMASLSPQGPEPALSSGIGLTGVLGIANMAAGIGRQVYEALKPGPRRPPPQMRTMTGNPFQ